MKRLITTGLLAAMLAGGVVLAAQDEHDHGQTKQGAAAGCEMMGQRGQHGQEAKGQERMAQMHERMATRRGESSKDDGHAGHGAQRGNAGQDCPMHSERKKS